MTREEFKGGWKLLKGAGLPCQGEPSEALFYGKLRDLPAKAWAEVVSRAIDVCTFFPVPAKLREIAEEVLRDQEIARRAALGLPSGPPDPRERVTFMEGRKDLPKDPNETFTGYLRRIATDPKVIADAMDEAPPTPAVRAPYREAE